MISANELRIGNIVKDADGNICTIRSIDSERSYTYKNVIYIGTASVFIHKYNGTTGKWIESLSPIHLTEELLLKCGFTDISSYKDFRLVINEDLYIDVSLRKNVNAYVSVSEIDIINVIYLHQLQNLYFAITGKELEVKL